MITGSKLLKRLRHECYALRNISSSLACLACLGFARVARLAAGFLYYLRGIEC